MKSKETGVYKYVLASTGEQYTGFFETKDEALAWYEKHGKWLEKQFNRKLVLKNQAETDLIEKRIRAKKNELAYRHKHNEILKAKQRAKRKLILDQIK